MSNSYPMVPLSEVLILYQEYIDAPEPKIYPKLSVKLYGKGVVLDAPVDGSSLKMQRHQIAKRGQVILSEIWGKKGAIGFVPSEGEGALCTSHFFLFGVRRDKIEPKYLQAIFTANYLEDQLNTEAKGTTGYAAVRPKHLLAASIPLPSIEEQRRIVARIEELAVRIEEARGLRREGVEEVDKFLTRTLSDAFKPHEDNMALIGVVFKVTTGSTPSRGNPLYWGGEIKWVSSGEVAFCRITDTVEKITELGLANSSAKVYPPNTVLIAMIGQGKTRGQVAILDCYAATNQNVAGIHVYDTIHNPEYVYWWLRSRYYESRLTETGTAQPALSGERVKQMLIPLPPSDEQHRIVTCLDCIQAKIDVLKRLQAETSAELDALLPSILDKAFKGDL
jgi:type I restriction enzyme, S subunit